MQIMGLRQVTTDPAMVPAAKNEDCRWQAEAAHNDASALGSRRRLQGQLVAQCEAMVQHAMAEGLAVPPELLGRFDACLAGENQGTAAAIPAPSSADALGAEPMTSTPRIQDLAAIHQTLTAIVAPATPAAILLFARERNVHPALSAIGPVPLIRHFLLLSVISLFTMLLSSLFDVVNVENMSKSLLELSGWSLLLVELFLLSAASLGSCFAILQQLNGYVAAGNYDPKYQATYWGRWVMGVISGILLSQILYAWFAHTLGNPDQEGSAAQVSLDLGQPALALLGGFSANLVRGLLNRIMTSIETLFGETK